MVWCEEYLTIRPLASWAIDLWRLRAKGLIVLVSHELVGQKAIIKESKSELDQVGDWWFDWTKFLTVCRVQFSSSHVVVVYDGKRAAMKAERLWHLHFQCWLLLFLWSHRKSVSSIKLFRCWGTLEYKSLWFCAVTRDQAAQYVRHVLSLLKGTPGTVRFKGVVWFVSSDSVNMRAFNVVIWEHCNGCSSDAVVSWMILYT